MINILVFSNDALLCVKKDRIFKAAFIIFLPYSAVCVIREGTVILMLRDRIVIQILVLKSCTFTKLVQKVQHLPAMIPFPAVSRDQNRTKIRFNSNSFETCYTLKTVKTAGLMVLRAK